jgi:glycosyltransferase involved in cell wall biosynthesis
MKILQMLPSLPHPSMRGELRHYYFLRSLSRRHDITVLALTKTAVAPEAEEELGRYSSRLVVVDASPPARPAGGDLLGWRARKQRRLRRAMVEMRRHFVQAVHDESFDVVLVHGADLYPVLNGFHDLPAVLDVCDAVSLRHRHRLRYVNPVELPWRLLSYWLVRRREEEVSRQAPHVAFISERDRDAVTGPTSRAAIVPNGVDLAYWSRRDPPAQIDRLVFTGVMDYPPNDDAAHYLVRHIVPAVRKQRPDVEVVIAGRSPSAALIDEARASGVTVTGFLQDLRPELEKSAVFVAPLRFASGMQNKILEAMAMQLPVVTTRIAAEGLHVAGGGPPPVAIADRPEAFAACVTALLGDRMTRAQMGMDGRDFVRRHFNWEKSAQRLERMCREAAGTQDEQREAVGGLVARA